MHRSLNDPISLEAIGKGVIDDDDQRMLEGLGMLQIQAFSKVEEKKIR